MGIYDREYYRRDGPSFLGSFASRGQVCKWLIILNIVAFVIQLMTQQRVLVEQDGFLLGEKMRSLFTDAFLLDVHAVLHGQVWRLLTYAFLHDPNNIWHIVWNMLFLWWFGSDLEDLYGSREFLAFYLVSAVVGGAAFVLAYLAHLSDGLYCLGASGAVTAVMVLCALHYPRRIILLFFVLPVPIWLLVVFQVAQDSLTFLSGARSQTAVTVHLGGAAFAFLYFKSHIRLLNLWPSFGAWQRQRARPKLRVYREEELAQPVVPVGAPAPAPPASADVDEQLEAKLDEVLEKVARFGQASLTDTERQILFRASEVYRKRRS